MATPKQPARPSSSAAPLPPLPASPPLLSVRLRVLGGPEVALGPGKAELLAAVAATGSITGAARQLGVSYMHAWSLVQTMNRCFRVPLVRSSRGGQRGGGAGLTGEGREVLSLYRTMAAEALRAAQSSWERLRPRLHGTVEGGADTTDGEKALASSTAGEDDGELMEQSIRNELPGTVKEVISDRVLSEVLVETASGEVSAVITTRSVREMGLKVGDRVAALVKATSVSVRRQG